MSLAFLKLVTPHHTLNVPTRIVALNTSFLPLVEFCIHTLAMASWWEDCTSPLLDLESGCVNPLANGMLADIFQAEA